MKDRILFIGGADTSKISNEVSEENYEQYFDIAGGNVGNFVYTMYLKSYIDYDIEQSQHIFFAQELDNIKNIDESFDKVVVCCANQINPRDTYLLQFYNFLEKTSLPIILLGLGCQSDVSYSMDFLHNIPEHIKFLNMLQKKKALIGVRGKFTKECFDRMGINCDITGCPSFYKNGSSITVKDNLSEHPLIDVSCEWFENKDIWYEVIEKTPCNIICQSRGELSLYKLSKSVADEGDYVRLQSLLGKKFTKDKAINESNSFIGRCRIFFKIDEWENFIKTRDFYIGPKIHGCLMHLINGIPALLIVHDSRTREFAEFMNIPHIMSSDIAPDMDLKKYYFSYNSRKFVEHYPKLFEQYTAFLDKAQLKYHF